MSGWSQRIDFKNRKVFEQPPIKLIKPDSSEGIEEDFSNHVEEFYIAPDKYKKSYPLIYNFLKARLN